LADAASEASPRRTATPLAANCYFVAAAIVLCTFESAQIGVGPFSLRFGQILCLAIVAFAFAEGWVHPRLAYGAMVMVMLFIGFSLPAVATYGFGRFSLALQFAVDILGMLGVASAALRMPKADLEKLVKIVVWTLVVLSAASIIFGFTEGGSEARLFDVARPSGLFVESTWNAIALAALLAVSLQRRQVVTTAVTTLLVLGIFTRAAALAGVVVYIAHFARSRAWLRPVVVVLICAAWIGSGWQAYRWITTVPSGLPQENSLDSRAWDIYDARIANQGKFFPDGGDELKVQEASGRTTTTSNVWPFEMIWKLGYGGLALIVAFGVFFLLVIPRELGVRLRWFLTQPAGVFIALAMPICVFNNALGRDWFWALLGLAFASLAIDDDLRPWRRSASSA
jgi:hypothetical protein